MQSKRNSGVLAAWLLMGLLCASVGFTAGVWSAPVVSFGIDGAGNLDVNGVESNTLRVAALTSGRIPISGTNGLIGDDADLRWVGGDTLTVANISAASNYVTTAYILGLTAGRVPLVGAGGLIGTDSDLTFSGDTLTSTKISTGQLTDTGLTSTRIPITGVGGLLGDDGDLTWTGGNTLTTVNIDAATVESNAYTVAGVPLNTYISGIAGGITVLTQASPYEYIVSESGGIYYANSTTGGTNYSNANFNTFWTAFEAGLADGDSVYFKSGIYTYSTILSIGGEDNISIVGERGAILSCDTAIATAGFRWLAANEDTHDKNIIIKGLTFDNNELTSGPSFKWVDHLTIEDCYVYDTVPTDKTRSGIVVTASAAHPCIDVKILHNTVENIGGSAINLSYVSNVVISSNTLIDACQGDYPSGGAIKTDLESNYITITGNVIRGDTNNDGMYLGESTAVTTATNYVGYSVTGNTIWVNDLHASATSGIKAYINYGVIADNTIYIPGTSDGSVGIHVSGLRNVISGNTIKCAGTAWAGIYMDNTVTTGRNIIIGNSIAGTDTYGIENEQDYNYFADNDINCPTGLHHIAGADQNNVIGGTFEGCTNEFSDAGTGNLAHAYINKTGSYVA
jgi:hypothetical protein